MGVGQIIHVLFSPSGAMSVRQAVAALGREDRVVGCHDDFTFGPIDPPNRAARSRWVEAELGYARWDEVVDKTDQAMAASLSPDARPIAWLSRGDGRDYAGFLEWLWRLGDAPCEVIDVTDVTVRRRRADGSLTEPVPAISPSLIAAEAMIDNGVLDRARVLTDAERRRYRAQWGRLRDENAALRITDGMDLTSAPISAFDDILLASALPRWKTMAWVVGDALWRPWKDDIRRVGDLVLMSRARTLAETGRLDWRGDLDDPRGCQVRLPSIPA